MYENKIQLAIEDQRTSAQYMAELLLFIAESDELSHSNADALQNCDNDLVPYFG
jgi:hypothetical protein